jgi:hypothetical protein
MGPFMASSQDGASLALAFVANNAGFHSNPIESKKQKANFLTKSLGMAEFEENRRLSCGW